LNGHITNRYIRRIQSWHTAKKSSIITKTRYVIPIENGLFVELDIFEGDLAPLVLAEIEFPDEAFAKAYQAPSWLKEDVTYSSEYHNSTLSKKD